MSNEINPREKDEDSITSEMYDEPNELHGVEIEKEPEFENNISTSLFIKDLVERMNKKAEHRLMGGGIFGQRANSQLDDPTGSQHSTIHNSNDYNQYSSMSREPTKLTHKQRVLLEVG